jgi:hypothetical protein
MGTFSITETPSASKAAGRMARAAFLPPLMIISPCKRFPPLIRMISKTVQLRF